VSAAASVSALKSGSKSQTGTGSGTGGAEGCVGVGGDSDISEIDRRILALQDYLENARYDILCSIFT
jgi:hypothetical protein